MLQLQVDYSEVWCLLASGTVCRVHWMNEGV